MTQKNKCDACRKAKRKCDEALPSCSTCISRGKTCTHSWATKEFIFLKVTGELVEDAESLPREQHCQGTGIERAEDAWSKEALPGRRKVALITTQRHNRKVLPPQKTIETCTTYTTTGELFHLQSETSSLLARWFSMMPVKTREEEDPMDGYGSWAIHVPPLIGKSQALDDASRCFMDSRQAIANPTDANLRAVLASNVAAVNSVRLALMKGGPGSCTGEILFAIQMLYTVEALLLHTRNAAVIHTKGLLSLLNQHKKHLKISDHQEAEINRIIFMCTFATGFWTALLACEDHEFDNPAWLDTPFPTIRITGISEAAVKSCTSNVVCSFILIPRLTRLVRELATSLGRDNDTEKEAIELAKLLFLTKYDRKLFFEGIASREIQHVPSILPELVELVPMSYRFGSTRVTTMQIPYWFVRLIICGLLDTLLSVSPLASQVFDAAAVHAEDIRTATDALMAAQHTLIASKPEDPAGLRAEKQRLAMVLQAGYGTWARLESRAQAPVAAGDEELVGGFPHARRMKQGSMDLLNQTLSEAGLCPKRKEILDTSSKFFAGRPLKDK